MTGKHCMIGIDLGLTGIKTGIFDTDGHCIGAGYEGIPIESPHPGWVEQDQNHWWSEARRTIKKALQEAKIPPDEIAAIGVTAHGHGLSPLSRKGEFLSKCLTSQDQRAIEQRRWLKENLGIGSGHEALISSKILWLKENRPEIFEKTYKFLFPGSVLLLKLTGEFAADVTNAADPAMFDYAKCDWSESLLDAAGIPREKLPEVYDRTNVVGEVTREAAEETGLAEGTPVIAGAMDGACCLYGAGLVKAGRCVDLTGTVGILVAAVPAKTSDKQASMGFMHSPAPGIVGISISFTRTAGGLYRWIRDQFCRMEVEVGSKTSISEYELMDREAEKVEPGSGGVFIIPHFVGRGMDLDVPRTGLIFGLTWTTRREQIIRAAMEGWAYEMRRGLEASKLAEKGIEIEEVRAVGGGGRSRTWRQIKADVLGIPFSRINIDELGCFGVAILAGVGVGIFKDVVSPIERIVKVVETNEPRDEYRERYDDLFKTYLKLNTTLEETGIYEQHNSTLERQNLI